MSSGALIAALSAHASAAKSVNGMDIAARSVFSIDYGR
jgi:hypothetical protein